MRTTALLVLAVAAIFGVLTLAKPAVRADPGALALPAPKYDIDPALVLAMHDEKSEQFVAVEGFGARRVISMFAFKHFSLAKGATRANWRASREQWEIVSIDVVGHAQTEPKTYMTQKIVAREKLTDIPTRKLDAFEARALGEIRAALTADNFKKDAHAETARFQAGDGTLRVLGSLRATKGCLDCHKAKEGDLLGALSYTLRPAKLEDPEAVMMQALRSKVDSMLKVEQAPAYLDDSPETQIPFPSKAQVRPQSQSR